MRRAGEAPALAPEAEAELVRGLQAMEEAAWSSAYERYAEQVYRYVYYRLGDPHTSEDLAADVFVKALAGIQGYAWRGTPLLAWFYRIAHNVTADYRKAAARRAERIAPGLAEDVPERTDALHELDERSDMLDAVRRLTEDQQQVILLRFYHGMSNAEVGAVIGKPEGAVKALQARGLKSLRRLLASRARHGV